eukprot:GAHX01001532.1.p1 GENE.GAHX01001532.1~~GAHX01001532.1.p1  ORF type:complete len:448 (+),score=79.13 GAHX01001532.1:1341-2684(+)
MLTVILALLYLTHLSLQHSKEFIPHKKSVQPPYSTDFIKGPFLGLSSLFSERMHRISNQNQRQCASYLFRLNGEHIGSEKLIESIQYLQSIILENFEFLKNLNSTKTIIRYNTWTLPDNSANNLPLSSLFVYYAHLNLKHEIPNKPWDGFVFKYNSLLNSTNTIKNLSTALTTAMNTLKRLFGEYLSQLREILNNYAEMSSNLQSRVLRMFKKNKIKHTMHSNRRHSVRIANKELKRKLIEIKNKYNSVKINDFSHLKNRISSLFDLVQFPSINRNEFEFLDQINEEEEEDIVFIKEVKLAENESFVKKEENKIDAFFEALLNEYKEHKSRIYKELNGNKFLNGMLENAMKSNNQENREKEIVDVYNKKFGAFHSFLANKTETLLNERKELRKAFMIILINCRYMLEEQLKDWIVEAKKISLGIKEHMVYQISMNNMWNEYQSYMMK